MFCKFRQLKKAKNAPPRFRIDGDLTGNGKSTNFASLGITLGIGLHSEIRRICLTQLRVWHLN